MVSERGSSSSSSTSSFVEERRSIGRNQGVYGSNPNLSDNSESVESDQDLAIKIQKVNKMSNKRKYNTDPLFLQGGDIPGAIITNSVLTRSHYYEWCTSIRLALEAKMKLGFIDGSFPMPFDVDELAQWKLVDAMVRSWIMNTIEQKQKVHFQNAVTAQELWNDIRSTYEGNNGPRRFQLGKDLATVQQGNSDIVGHYSKVKLIWDELAHLKPARKCSCDRSDVANCVGCMVSNEVAQDLEESKLLQFLMGVNDSYEHVIDNMLASDPWPSVHKAFTILVNVETKRSINMVKGENLAMVVKEKIEWGNKISKSDGIPKSVSERFKPHRNSICSHCGLKGHVKEGCFKILGYPDWYKQPKKKFAVSINVANTSTSPLDETEETTDQASAADFKQFKEWCKSNSKGKGKASVIGNADFSADGFCDFTSS